MSIVRARGLKALTAIRCDHYGLRAEQSTGISSPSHGHHGVFDPAVGAIKRNPEPLSAARCVMGCLGSG